MNGACKWVILLGLAPGLPASGAEFYTFTSIAETGQTYTEIGYPSINDSGDVSFTATPTSFPNIRPYAVYLGNGQTTSTYYAYPADFSPASQRVNLSDTGYFAYIARFPSGLGVVRANGLEATVVLPFVGGGSYYGPDSINASNQVLTRVLFLGGLWVIYRGEADGSLTQVLDSNGPLQAFGDCAMNDNGLVVASAVTDANQRALVRSTGGPYETLYTNAGPVDFFRYVSINNSGLVAFTALLDDESSAIFTGSGGPLSLLTDTHGPYDGFSWVRMNNVGQVVFEASLDGGGYGVFFGPDPVANRVLATGDSLLGSSVTEVRFIDALNDLGQIALRARLSDGRIVIVRADPIPEPQGTILLMLCFAIVPRWRRVRDDQHRCVA